MDEFRQALVMFANEEVDFPTTMCELYGNDSHDTDVADCDAVMSIDSLISKDERLLVRHGLASSITNSDASPSRVGFSIVSIDNPADTTMTIMPPAGGWDLNGTNTLVIIAENDIQDQ